MRGLAEPSVRREGIGLAKQGAGRRGLGLPVDRLRLLDPAPPPGQRDAPEPLEDQRDDQQDDERNDDPEDDLCGGGGEEAQQSLKPGRRLRRHECRQVELDGAIVKKLLMGPIEARAVRRRHRPRRSL